MQLTLQTQLLPDAEQAAALEAVVTRFNEAACWLAGEAFAVKITDKFALHRIRYAHIRERFGLSAQMAVRCIAQVCEAYKRDRSKRPRFRKFAAMPFDQRMMSFKGADRVSLLTLEGRIVVPIVMGSHQRGYFNTGIGQCDLLRRKDGKWFLLVTVDLPDGPRTPATDFIGVDLGIVNIAATSDDDLHSGDGIEACRLRYHLLRRSLQKAAAGRKRKERRPRSIRRKLQRISGREAHFRRHTNHVISKAIVATAKGTGRGIALENLRGILDRLRLHKRQRARFFGWSFDQIRRFFAYKSALAGVEFVIVAPRDTSITCPVCGVVDKASRISLSQFRCQHCGHEAQADINAARNIRAKALLVNGPKVSCERISA